MPYERNPRRHDPAQVDQIVASIREFGWTVPILIDRKRRVIAGHGRLMAARAMGMKRVPCMYVPKRWTEAQRRAYVIADNKLTLNGAWDDELLAGELAALVASPELLQLTGFGDKELERLGKIDVSGYQRTEPQLGAGFKYSIVVDCKDERDQAALLQRLEQEGRTCRLLTL